MSFSSLFIVRPVATTLLTIGLVLLGIVSWYQLQVAPLPRVDIPTIKVSASMPGASPETMAAAVTAPLERFLGRIAGVTEMTSTSAQGFTRIVLQFDLKRDINGAARDVQAALNAARGGLPPGLLSPTYRKVNPADAPVMILGLTSTHLSQGQMYEVASTVIAQKLSQLQGVGEVEIGGSSLPAVRVDLNPQALSQYGIAFEDVRNAIVASNSNLPQGSIESGDRQWQVFFNSRSVRAEEFEPVIVKYRSDGASVRLTDVADISNSVEEVRNAGLANGQPAVLLIIRREPDANIIETVDRINQLLPALQGTIPAAMKLSVMMERTSTIRASMQDAGYTLGLAIVLVFLVVLVFLRNGRAALVLSVSVPVSVIGSFVVMYLLNFSLNNLSLMALIIAIGFVVDDAIVVLENVSRHVDRGIPAIEAARIGAKEVSSTVLTMTLVLIAVFIPMLLMGGYVGLFVHEFAVTLAASILISLVVALTVTPMMCARLLQRTQPGLQQNLAYAWSERAFAALLHGYERSLAWVLGHAPLTMLVLLLTVLLNIYLYIVIPKGFFPQQDTGQLSGRIQADQSVSFPVMLQKMTTFVDIVRADPAVAEVVAFTGGAQRNVGSLFVTLKSLNQRNETADKVSARLRIALDKVPGATLILSPVQDIRVGGRQSRSTYEYTLQSDDIEQLRVWEPKIRTKLAQLPELIDVDTDNQSKGLQTTLVIDREAAARLGISPRQIDTVLNDAFAQRPVSVIYQPLNQYRVVMGIASTFAQSSNALDSLQIIGPHGRPVPFSMLARYELTETSLSVNHHSQFVATTISFNLGKGVSLSQATRAINQSLREIAVPSSVRGSFQGSARAFREVLDSQPVLIMAALITLYIVLGVLYESLIHPLTILSTLPSAGIGALFALMVFKTDFNVIAMIGIFMLIGIVMKNAIMMIDFALDAQRQTAANPTDAIYQACLLRFRPILMTSLAALLAAIPLAISRGDGAEMRQPLGIAIAGGLIVSQLLTLYTTPVVYLYLDRFSTWARRKSHLPNSAGEKHLVL